MSVFIIAKELEADLDRLFETDSEEATAADLLLELLYEGNVDLDNLHPPETVYRHNPTFEFKRFTEAHQQGLNAYILKYWDPDHGHLCNHRILVGCNPATDRYYALTIPARDRSYDTGSSDFQEFVHRYKLCGVPFLAGHGNR
jgi:hypothetical protein